MPTHLQIIALDKITYEDDVDVVVLPGADGQLGILPRHAPVVTILQPGEILVRKGGEEIPFAVSGGFAQISPERVTILADAAEHAEEIDIERAEAARQRAQDQLTERRAIPSVDAARAEAALRRSLMRLKVAERVGRRRGRPGPPPA